MEVASMVVEVPDADVVDRITILEIKVDRLPVGAAHAQRELDVLLAAWSNQAPVPLHAVQGLERLRVVNRALWDVEDALRAKEAAGDFGPGFVDAARSVYELNDERSRLKARIGEQTGSRLLEQKSYGPPSR